jgi:excinuclease UvrABC nuclease subunit
VSHEEMIAKYGEPEILTPHSFDAVDCFWAMCARAESRCAKLEQDDIQNAPGVYFFMSWDNWPIRIGKAVKLRNRIISYWSPANENISSKFWENDLAYVGVFYTGKYECEELERNSIIWYQPKLNTVWVNPANFR